MKRITNIDKLIGKTILTVTLSEFDANLYIEFDDSSCLIVSFTHYGDYTEIDINTTLTLDETLQYKLINQDQYKQELETEEMEEIIVRTRQLEQLKEKYKIND